MRRVKDNHFCNQGRKALRTKEKGHPTDTEKRTCNPVISGGRIPVIIIIASLGKIKPIQICVYHKSDNDSLKSKLPLPAMKRGDVVVIKTYCQIIGEKRSRTSNWKLVEYCAPRYEEAINKCGVMQRLLADQIIRAYSRSGRDEIRSLDQQTWFIVLR